MSVSNKANESQWKKVSRVVENVIAYGVTATVVCTICLYINLNVITRKVFDYSFMGMTDTLSLSIIAGVFSAMALAQREKRHITMDLLTSKLKGKRSGLILSIVTLAISVLAAVVLLYGTGRFGLLAAYQQHWVTDSVYITKWPVITLAPLGYLLWCNRMLIDLVDLIKQLRLPLSEIPQAAAGAGHRHLG